MEADFSGYGTKNGIECSDGRVINVDAFKHQDTTTIPLVWQHQHNTPANVLGHAILENRPDGVYVYGFFNDTKAGKESKALVRHGDITALSIYANRLVQKGASVVHGFLTEVSLVMQGANPGALIDNVNLAHGANGSSVVEEEAVIYTGLSFEHSVHSEEEGAPVANSMQEVFETLNEDQKTLVHSLLEEALSDSESTDEDEDEDTPADEVKHAADSTVKEVFESLNEEQKKVVYYMIAEALGDDDDEPTLAQSADTESTDSEASTSLIQHSQEDNNMTIAHNIFDNSEVDQKKGNVLSHAQIKTIVDDGIKMGSFKESFLAHAGEYGITNIDLLFPDAQSLTSTPELIARQAEWVPKVLGATKHTPFAKTKSIVADLTADEARAKGYIKGNVKTEEVISLLRRTTSPTTVYKKQKLDRDDILDITDFDVVTWLKWEIRFMLNEEIARAILIGDGRSTISPDKIRDPAGAIDGIGIRSIANDHEIYAHKVQLAANVSPDVVIDEVTRARTYYRGSGSPTYYTTDKNLTDLLLLKDKMGRRLYETEASLASALRVKEIVSVEVIEEVPDILGIIVNLTDYSIGTNKGGELSFFEDFDIDFNQNKYLMETRMSGALTKPKSAIVIRRALGLLATASAPSFNGTTNTITVPTSTGVDYLIEGVVVTGNVVITKTTEIVAEAKSGYYFAANSTTSWTYTYTAA